MDRYRVIGRLAQIFRRVSDDTFPKNGFACVADLDSPRVRASSDAIVPLEHQYEFRVLRYWNRRWEYAFFMEIADRLRPGLAIDAGAGRSLFPFWLRENGWSVTAADIDDGSFYPEGSLADWYATRRQGDPPYVEFQHVDLRAMPMASATFDAVFCMSVLEHVEDPLRALGELVRLVKSGGSIVLTVDVSLDGTREMRRAVYEELVGYLDAALDPVLAFSTRGARDLLTTDWFLKHDPSGLPWLPRPGRDPVSRLSDRQPDAIEGYYSMAVAGLAYRKR